MALLARLEHSDRLDENYSSVNDIVAAIRERILQQHPETILAARQDPGKRTQLREMVVHDLTVREIKSAYGSRETLAECVVQRLVGYGPIDSLLEDNKVTEIMINGPSQVFVESDGQLHRTDLSFDSDEQLADLILRIVAPLGRRVDRSNPYVDGRLPDGSRINVILPPLSLQGPIVTIRRFPNRMTELDELIDAGTLSVEMSDFLRLVVAARLNVIISGGTSSGKTTTLTVLCGLVPASERIICMEDTSEISVRGRHLVNLETRPPNLEGQGEVTIRQLVRNSLRMRPDRLIIGEVRGPEAFDLIQAMNTGHNGSMATVHANNGTDALKRLEGMVLTAGQHLPVAVIRQHLAAAVDLVIHQIRDASGQRRIVELAAAKWNDATERVELVHLFHAAGSGWQTTTQSINTGAAPLWLQQRLGLVPGTGERSRQCNPY